MGFLSNLRFFPIVKDEIFPMRNAALMPSEFHFTIQFVLLGVFSHFSQFKVNPEITNTIKGLERGKTAYYGLDNPAQQTSGLSVTNSNFRVCYNNNGE